MDEFVERLWSLWLSTQLSVASWAKGWEGSEPNAYIAVPVIILGLVIAVAIPRMKWLRELGDVFRAWRAVRALHRQRTNGGKPMTRKRQEQYEKDLIAQIITDGLEEAEFRNKIPRSSVEKWYKKFADKFGMRSLEHKHMTQAEIKQEIKKRLGNGAYHPVVIPGDPPPPVKKKGSAQAQKLHNILHRHLI